MSVERCEECGGFGAQEREDRILCKRCWMYLQHRNWKKYGWDGEYTCTRCSSNFTPLYGFETLCSRCWATEKRIRDSVKLKEQIDQWKREYEWMKREAEAEEYEE